MPGAELTGVEGDEYHRSVKIGLGAVTAEYEVVANFELRWTSMRREP